MGRVKLKIKKLESISNRHVTYSKRKSGIIKKAKELSILCDIDVVLLMFSPTGKPTLLQGERSNIEEIIAKFAQLSPQERAKRKMESLEELSYQVKVLQAQITEVQQRLSYWNNLEKINNLEHLRQMEDSLRESINRVGLQKEGMALPSMMASLQDSQPLSWLLNDDNHHLMLPNEPKFQSFSDNTNRDVECSTDISLPNYSGYIGSNKFEVGSSPQVTTLGQGGGAMNELNGTTFLNVQCCDQFAYPPPPDIEEVKQFPTMDNKSNTVDYQVHNNFDLPRSLFENGHQFWNSASGSCGIAMFNENNYHK
ncbi:Agamous-like MADS-box protein AGL65 [Glycine soja]